MGLFDRFKKSAPKPTTLLLAHTPYSDDATNFIYNLLFCDNAEMFKASTQEPLTYPYDVLFSTASTDQQLQKVIDDDNIEPRLKLLAYNQLRLAGHKASRKELLGVIVEVGLDQGLDVLASFKDGTARYINQTGKILVWETRSDATANELTRELFTNSQQIVEQIGPWDKPRRPAPAKGNTRISFLVSDGLYFGEASTDVLFNDALAKPALMSATRLMQYITETSIQKK